MASRKGKGIGLLSGGLDSLLAVKVLQQQELELRGIIFSTPFFGPKDALDYESMLEIPVQLVDIGEVHMAMLKKPIYGYGSQMNPCIDCHALMLKEAGRIMEREGADFLFTGEVLGQRPMSQRRDSLRSVEKLSGFPGRVLRPLSARLLPPTTIELEGLVDRSKLLDIHGRSRKRQAALAEQFGISDYPQPGGGCVLTKQGFVNKLRTLFDRYPQAGVREAHLLGCGRFFQLPLGHVLLVGRDHADNEKLEKLADQRDYLLQVEHYPGPRGLLVLAAEWSQDVLLAAQIVAGYSDAPVNDQVLVAWQRGRECGTLRRYAADRNLFRHYMV